MPCLLCKLEPCIGCKPCLRGLRGLDTASCRRAPAGQRMASQAPCSASLAAASAPAGDAPSLSPPCCCRTAAAPTPSSRHHAPARARRALRRPGVHRAHPEGVRGHPGGSQGAGRLSAARGRQQGAARAACRGGPGPPAGRPAAPVPPPAPGPAAERPEVRPASAGLPEVGVSAADSGLLRAPGKLARRPRQSAALRVCCRAHWGAMEQASAGGGWRVVCAVPHTRSLGGRSFQCLPVLQPSSATRGLACCFHQSPAGRASCRPQLHLGCWWYWCRGADTWMCCRYGAGSGPAEASTQPGALQVRLQALQGWATLVDSLTQQAPADLVTVANQVVGRNHLLSAGCVLHCPKLWGA